MGQAIIFVVLLAAWAVVTIYLVTIAARTYFIIVQNTAAGIDRVEWPDEPFYDRLLTGVYFLALAGIMAMPAGLLSRAFAQRFLPHDPALRYFVLAGPLLWLYFPVGLLSSMAASSRWAVLSPRVLVGLLRLAPTMVVFYLVTGLLAAGTGALVFLGLFGRDFYVLPIAAVAMSAAWMIHARLVGRLGWLLFQQQTAGQPKGRAEEGPRRRMKRAKALPVEDPWADPEEEEPAPPARAGALTYAVVEREEPRPPVPHYVEPPPDPYAVTPTIDEPRPDIPPEPPRVSDEQLEREVALRRRDPPNPPPAFPLWSGVYEFPLYESSRRGLATLVVFGAASGAMFRMLLMRFPH